MAQQHDQITQNTNKNNKNRLRNPGTRHPDLVCRLVIHTAPANLSLLCACALIQLSLFFLVLLPVAVLFFVVCYTDRACYGWQQAIIGLFLYLSLALALDGLRFFIASFRFDALLASLAFDFMSYSIHFIIFFSVPSSRVVYSSGFFVGYSQFFFSLSSSTTLFIIC